MKRIPLLSIALACALFPLLPATPAYSQKRRSPATGRDDAIKKGFDRSRFQIPNKKFVLDNGLTLVVHEDHNVPLVAVNVWYHVGSRNESRGKTGFAHLFEHFFFNGSENYPHGFREAMDDLGANNRNGTTNGDRTNFFEDVPVSALDRTLYLEADRMGFLYGRITKDMLERERGVVQNEKRQGENQPYGRVYEELVGRIYPYSHPYSWSTIGSMEDLNAASLDDVRQWYKTYYAPNNAVLVLSGDITADHALELVKKYFGGIPPGPALVRTAEWIPKLDRNIRDEMEDRVPQARIYRVYHAPSWKNPELQNLSLFTDVLAGSRSARLNRRLIYDKGLATSVNASVDQNELASTVIVTATVKDGVDPRTVETEMDSVISELITKGPTVAEVQRAQSRNLAAFLRGRERLGPFGGRADTLAESMTYGGDPDIYLNHLETMATATPADVKSASEKWLTANHYTMLVKPFPKLAVEKNNLDRSKLPPLDGAPGVKFPEMQRATLKNGLKVLLLERRSSPIVNMTMAVDAGFASDPVGKSGLASLSLGLMQEGSQTRDAFEIADQLDALGAQMNASSSLDLSFVRLQSVSENLRPSLSIFADVLLHPAFPQDKFLLQQKLRLAQIGQEKAQPVSLAMRILPGILYGSGNSYGNPNSGFGYESTVETLTREDLKAWHDSWFHPGNSTLIVTGDVSLDKLLPALEGAFGQWQTGSSPKKTLSTAGPTKGKRVYLIDKPDATQSVIVAAHLSEPGGQPDDLAIETVMRNFGGLATSRLNRNLRLDKHWSYGTQGQLIGARGQRPFVVIAPVQTDKTKESMVEVEKEIRGVAGERPLAGEEYSSIMRNSTLRLPGRFETLAALDAAAVETINYGRPADYWSDYSTAVRALTEPQLATAAKRFVHPDEVVWIVVGDLAKVEKGIRELGLGEVILLDSDGKPIH